MQYRWTEQYRAHRGGKLFKYPDDCALGWQKSPVPTLIFLRNAIVLRNETGDGMWPKTCAWWEVGLLQNPFGFRDSLTFIGLQIECYDLDI